MTTASGETYCVRAFDAGKPGEEHPALPYSLLKAAVTMDIWGIGCVVFQLLFREPIVPVNPDEDVVSAAAMQRAATWDQVRAGY